MTDADAPADDSQDAPATEEETQAANALRQALEGRRAGTHLPEPALEAAALLRSSSDRGRLAHDRQAALRAELMASLTSSPVSHKQARKGLRHWLGLGFTLAGGATAAIVIGVIGARHWGSPEALQEAPFSDGLSITTTPTGSQALSPAAAPEPPPLSPAPLRSAAHSESESAKGELSAETTPAANASAGVARARGAMPQVQPSPRFAAQGQATREARGPDALGGGAAYDARRERLTRAPAEARADDADRPALRTWAPAPAAEAKKAAPQAQPAVPTEQVRRESDKYRAELLAELADPELDGAYGELDRAQSRAELEHARERLGSLASGSLGGSQANAERLRPDIYCRLAEVALRLGQPEAALDWARRGLALGAPASPFVARLYLLQGQAKSALGDRDGAAKSYLKAIEVNEQLLDQSLEAP